MSRLLPRALVHRGVHLAAGLWLEDRLVPAGERRRRILALWEPGVRVLRMDGGVAVLFVRPRPVDAALAPGHLLLDVGGALVAAPIPAAEVATLAPPPGGLVVVRAGEAVALSPGVEENPAEWLGLSPELLKVESLGPLPASPTTPQPTPEPDVRLALAVPPAAAAAGEAIRALRTARVGAKPRPRPGDGAPDRLGLLGRGASALVGLLMEELSLLAGAFSTPADGGSARGRAATRPVPGPPSAPGPIRLALRQAWGRFLLLSRIARIAGFRQGAYLGRLLGMFEGGDLREALRHAIPLGGADGLADIPALGLPAVRASLVITPRSGAGGTISVGDSLLAEMRRVYRRAFEQLEASGRHEEAAFVLAELLRADDEAVSFLERHGRLRLAAELAEARGLPPGLCVRQWFLAGDVERATTLARARHAFADAVERLERSRRGREAGALRLLWAEELAEAGDFEAAVEVAAKVDDTGPLVKQWIDLALAAGGTAGHALLPLLAELSPQRFPEVRDRVFDACADEGADGPWRRGAIARGFTRVPSSGGARILARAVLRGRLADGALGRSVGSAPPQLEQLASDGAIDADLPPGNPVRMAPAMIDLRLRADDRGARAAHDAAVLPNGRVLVALGEAGVALLARDGREIARFDAPAHRLVVSDLGSRALALARRGEACRVSRLDIDARRTRPLRDLRLRAWADSFDGSTWAVSSGRSVLLLDALREDLRTLWHVPELPGPPVALERTASRLSFVTIDAEDAAEGWVYSLPDPTLRRREALSRPPDGAALLGLGGFGAGRWFCVIRPAAGGETPVLRPTDPLAPWSYALDPAAESVALGAGEPLAVVTRTPDDTSVRLFDPARLTPLAAVTLGRGSAAEVRADGPRITIADIRGRVIGLDLSLGRVTHDLRT